MDSISNMISNELQSPTSKQNLEYLFSLFQEEKIDASIQTKEQWYDLEQWLLSFEEVDDENMEQYCEIGEKVSRFAQKSECVEIFQKLRIQFYESVNRLEDALQMIHQLEQQLIHDAFLKETKNGWKSKLMK